MNDITDSESEIEDQSSYNFGDNKFNNSKEFDSDSNSSDPPEIPGSPIKTCNDFKVVQSNSSFQISEIESKIIKNSDDKSDTSDPPEIPGSPIKFHESKESMDENVYQSTFSTLNVVGNFQSSTFQSISASTPDTQEIKADILVLDTMESMKETVEYEMEKSDSYSVNFFNENKKQPKSEKNSDQSDEDIDELLSSHSEKTYGKQVKYFPPQEFKDTEKQDHSTLLKDYDQSTLDTDVKSLFHYIDQFQPDSIVLDEILMPFLPNYIPSIGNIHDVLQIPAPDQQEYGIGTLVLPEPALEQTSRAEMDLLLRSSMKIKSLKNDIIVHSIENAENCPKLIEKWIEKVQNIHGHGSKNQQIYHKHPMPSIEELMDIWPTEMEESFQQIALPYPELDMDLITYARVLCTLLDIPVHPNDLTTSLHLMFLTYLGFKENPHFKE